MCNINKKTLKSEVKSIIDICFEKLTIPPYQRPYKWSAKNVNDLITDLITFKNNSQYRLGALILYNNGENLEIVDGQQRIITLTLLIKILSEQFLQGQDHRENYDDILGNIDKFLEKTKFSNRYSLHNIVENCHVIEERSSYLDESVLDFIIKKCEFVVIELYDLGEAFQFFDSQNGRGKDLKAHDLLKAFHLREITEMTEADYNSIDEWQNQKTEFLTDIFLILFRAKRWSQGKHARAFTKNDIHVFKGVSIHDKKRYPYYQLEVIAHIFTQMYSRDLVRVIDQFSMEYPYNFDDQIVNGSRFFDMIRHYIDLYLLITDSHYIMANEIIKLINDYDGINRTGDQHVRSLFDTTLLYYVDRFGMEELDKVIPKIFIWAYRIRLENRAVQLSTIDNYAIAENSLIRFIHNAQTPYDIINLSIDINAEKDTLCTKCDTIKDQFIKLKKTYINDNRTINN